MNRKRIFSLLTLILLIVLVGSTSAFAQTTANLTWYNPSASEIPVIEGRGWQTGLETPYDRLPQRVKSSVRTPLWNLSKNTAGLYISFKTSATTIVVRYKVEGSLSMAHMPTTGVSGVDLYARNINGQWAWAKGGYSFKDTIEYRFSNLALSAKEEEFRLYLPLYNSVTWLSIGVPSNETFAFQKNSDEKPIVVYGTSIAQGGCATRPGLAWTNILGRAIDHPIINLGFSGNGQLEVPLVDMMNELDASVYVLDCMPNLVASDKLSKQEIQQRILTSVRNLQDKHGSTPILLVEHCGGLVSSNMDSSLVRKYKDASNILDESFRILQQEGRQNLYLLTDKAIGMDIESTVDGTHPNDIGMMKYAKAYEGIIRQILKEEKGDVSTTVPIRQRRDYGTYDFMQRHNAIIKAAKEKQPQLVLIGDSITHFWGGEPDGPVKNGNDAWEKYIKPLNPINLGFGWDKIENVLWRLQHGELDSYSAPKIIVMIGTNNLSVGDTDENILEGLKLLVKTIRQRQSSAQLFLSGIYPRRNYEKRVDGLNRKIALLAKSMQVAYINPGVVLLKSDSKIDEALFKDGLHPNKVGYDKLGQAIVKSIKH